MLTDANRSHLKELFQEKASQWNTTLLITGKEDMIVSASKCEFITNGTPAMSQITGTGCMLGMICATYLAVTDPFTAAVSAAREFGTAGERAEKNSSGPGSFQTELFDQFYNSFIICNLSIIFFIKKFPSDNMDKFLPYHLRTFLYYFRTAHFSQFSSRKHNRQRKCRCICDRSCIHHSINSHKQREDNDQWQKKNHLSCQRHYNTQLRHTDRSKETGRYRLDTVCKGHKHKYFQITFCKLKIQLTSCSEDTHDLVWKYLETEKEYRCN